MGCATVREKIESKMMMLKLEKEEIITEREERIKELQQLTGEVVKRKEIPDYLDKDALKHLTQNHNDKEKKNKKEIEEESFEKPDESNE